MSTKIKFLARFLVLTVFVTFVGCNEELYDVKDQHNGVDKNKISLAQFKNETNIGKVEPILSVSATKSISSKTKTQLSDFVIDTLAIKKHISENNKTTYSFRIYPLSAVAKPNEIYNLVYRLVNGNWEKSIFYLLKKEKVADDHKLFEKIELIYGGKVSKIATSKTAYFDMCAYEVPIVQCNGSCKTGVCDGFGCSTGECIVNQVRYGICETGGGSSTGGGSPDPGGTFSSGGGTPDPYVYSPNTYDNPVFDDPEYIYRTKREQIWTNLGEAAQYFFASSLVNMNFFNETIQYQIINTWSPESYVFANLARNYKFENPDAEIDFEYRIINTLKGKALCVYNKLMASSTGFKNAIKKFDGKFPVSHLKFEIDSNMPSNTTRAYTRAPQNYIIDIVLNGNSTKDASYQKRPNLLVAKTIIHEVIHAEMFRKLLSLANKNGNINVSLVNQMLQQSDYPGMLDYYFRNGEDINSSWQHQQMATHYRETIGRVLQEFDTGIVVPLNQSPSQFYTDLAWEGLNDSSIIEWQNAINHTERTRINNVINSYISLHSNQNCTN